MKENLRCKIKTKKQALTIIICLMISNYVFAEKYRLDFPDTSHGGTSCNTTWCGSYFDSGFIELSSNGSNRSKIKIRFIPHSFLEEENEAYLYVLTLSHDAAATNISFININPIGVFPAQASEEEQKSAIPGGIASYAEGRVVTMLPGIVGKALPFVKIAAGLLEPTQLAREPSMLSILNENSILDRELYPYHSYYQFFNRLRGAASTATFTINKPLSVLKELVRTKKMSLYIGGQRENEVLIEGITRLEKVLEDNSTSVVELNQNGHWISSGGRNPNTYRNIKYNFTLGNAGNISIKLDATRSNDAYLYLLNSQNEIIARNDDSGGDRDSFIENLSLNAGVYTIIAATYRIGKTGDFTLSVTGAVTDFHRKLP